MKVLDIYIEISRVINNMIMVESMVENKKFDDKKYENDEITNIRYVNCTFDNIKFENCKFEDVVFENCKFNYSIDGTCLFDNRCSFIRCTFENCIMEEVLFIDADFDKTNFILCDLRGSTFLDSKIEKISIIDCDMRNIKVINPRIDIFSFEDNYLSKLDEDSFIGEIIIDKKDIKSYEKASKVYKDISMKFEMNRLPHKAGEYYYLSKITEHKTLKGLERIKSNIYWALCGYGEKPTYALITSIEIVLIFTILYMFSGLRVDGEVINYNFLFFKQLPIKELLLDFSKSMYFSIVTFTTVGYGDITPIGLSVFLSGIEMFLGVTMVGVWTATLARKIVR